MRFCMVTTFYPPFHFGGDAMCVYRLSNELAARGHSVHIIFAADAYRLLAGHEPEGDYPNHPNITLHLMQHRLTAAAPLIAHQTGAPLTDLGMIRDVFSSGIDVIHYHNVSLAGGPAVLAMGDAIKLYTLHEYWLICPTHVLFKNQDHACEKPECLPCILNHGRPPQLWRYTGAVRRAMRHIDAFIAPSRFVAEMHRQRGLDLQAVSLPYFVPTLSGNATATMNMEGDEPYFLFVGRLEKLKGLHTLLPTFREYPKARLLIAGTGTDETHLREMAKDIANVRFLGQQPEDALQALYQNASAVIVPSITYDVAPLVVMEAFAHGTPVIGRNIGGIPEMIAESGGGYIYDDDAGLIAAMDALLVRRHREELGRRAHQTYSERWIPEAHLRDYFALIERLQAERMGNQP